MRPGIGTRIPRARYTKTMVYRILLVAAWHCDRHYDLSSRADDTPIRADRRQRARDDRRCWRLDAARSRICPSPRMQDAGVDDVARWLVERAELPQYEPAFRENKVDGPMLLDIVARDMLPHLVENPLHQCRLRSQLATFEHRPAVHGCPSAPSALPVRPRALHRLQRGQVPVAWDYVLLTYKDA